jgi:hypothetical protein
MAPQQVGTIPIRLLGFLSLLLVKEYDKMNYIVDNDALWGCIYA